VQKIYAVFSFSPEEAQMKAQWINWTVATWEYFFLTPQDQERVFLYLDDEILNHHESFRSLGGKLAFVSAIKTGPCCKVLNARHSQIWEQHLNNLEDKCLALMRSSEIVQDLHVPNCLCYGGTVGNEGCFSGLRGMANRSREDGILTIQKNPDQSSICFVPSWFLYLMACIYTINISGSRNFYDKLREIFGLTFNPTSFSNIRREGFFDRVGIATQATGKGFFEPEQGGLANLGYLLNECLFPPRKNDRILDFFDRFNLTNETLAPNGFEAIIRRVYEDNQVALNDENKNIFSKFHDDILERNVTGNLIIRRLANYLKNYDGTRNDLPKLFNPKNKFKLQLVPGLKFYRTPIGDPIYEFNGFLRPEGKFNPGILIIPFSSTQIKIDPEDELFRIPNSEFNIFFNTNFLKCDLNYDDGHTSKVRLDLPFNFKYGFMYLRRSPYDANLFFEEEHPASSAMFAIAEGNPRFGEFVPDAGCSVASFIVNFGQDFVWKLFNIADVNLQNENPSNLNFIGGSRVSGRPRCYRKNNPPILRVTANINLEDLSVSNATLVVLLDQNIKFKELKLEFNHIDEDIVITVTCSSQNLTETITLTEVGGVQINHDAVARLNFDLIQAGHNRGWFGYNWLETNNTVLNVINDIGGLIFVDCNNGLLPSTIDILNNQFNIGLKLLDNIGQNNRVMSYGDFKRLLSGFGFSSPAEILRKLCRLGHAEIQLTANGVYNRVVSTPVCGNLLPVKFNNYYAVSLTGTYGQQLVRDIINFAIDSLGVQVDIRPSCQKDGSILPPRIIFYHKDFKVLSRLFDQFNVPIVRFLKGFEDKGKIRECLVLDNDLDTLPVYDTYMANAMYFDIDKFNQGERPWCVGQGPNGANANTMLMGGGRVLCKINGDTSLGMPPSVYFGFTPNINKLIENNGFLDVVGDREYPLKRGRLFSYERFVFQMLYFGNMLNDKIKIQNTSNLQIVRKLRLPEMLERVLVSCSGLIPEEKDGNIYKLYTNIPISILNQIRMNL